MSWICPKCETENPDKLKVCEVCDTPREVLRLDKLKDELKRKYPGPIYSSFIRYHYNLLERADKGYANAQYQVGEWFYEHGEKRESDDYYKIAFMWYKMAATMNHVDAQYKLARCFEEGKGIPIIIDAAIKWYKKAADEGDERALNRYITLKYRGELYGQVLKHRYLLVVAAESGDKSSQYQLGEWFRNHDISSTYREEAIAWYTKAANNMHAGAMYQLGVCYEEGFGVHKFYNQALEWYRKAANAGNKPACKKLATTYLYGILGNKDVAQAVKWFEKSGQEISKNDLCNIGYAYDVGDGVPMNKATAIVYYKKAAEKGDAVAQYNLGVCYENGSGVIKNDSIAELWYQRAVSQGYKQAQTALDNLNKRKLQISKHNENSGIGGCIVELFAYIIGNFIIIFLVADTPRAISNWGVKVPGIITQYINYETSPISTIIIGLIISHIVFLFYYLNEKK